MRNIVLFVAVISITAPVAAQRSEMSWLAGAWSISTRNGNIVETWHLESDSVLTAKSEMVRTGKEPVLQETLRLERRNGQWFYVSRVEGQNQGQAITFTVIFVKGEEFICENPAHDFPQRIAYRKLGDRLFASIEGRENGVFRKVNFDYRQQ